MHIGTTPNGADFTSTEEAAQGDIGEEVAEEVGIKIGFPV
jgi:hypothetical protein